MNTPSTEAVFVKPSDLAERWATPVHTIHRLCARGEIPHMRIGKLIRIPLDAIYVYERLTLRWPTTLDHEKITAVIRGTATPNTRRRRPLPAHPSPVDVMGEPKKF